MELNYPEKYARGLDNTVSCTYALENMHVFCGIQLIRNFLIFERPSLIYCQVLHSFEKQSKT